MLPQQQAQKPAQKLQPKSDFNVRSRVMAAKTALGLKDLNVAAAVAGHKLYAQHAEKNPNQAPSQILNKISPNARTQYLKLSSAIPSEMLSDKVPMNQFRSTLQKLKQTHGSIRKEEYEIIDVSEVQDLAEASFKDEQNPPVMLVLKRRGIRIFPDGKRVALYTNDKLGLTFTIPYMPTGTSSQGVIPGVQTEETEVEEMMESLEQVAKFAQEESPKQTSRHMKFADGSKLKVSHGAAKAIHLVHGALNDDNKKKFETLLQDPKGFEKAAHFALNRVDFTINKK